MDFLFELDWWWLFKAGAFMAFLIVAPRLAAILDEPASGSNPAKLVVAAVMYLLFLWGFAVLFFAFFDALEALDKRLSEQPKWMELISYPSVIAFWHVSRRLVRKRPHRESEEAGGDADVEEDDDEGE